MNKIHLQKEAQHGTPQFRFQAFSQRDTCGQYFAPYHWHDEAEFLYVTEGSITLRTETGTKILSAGQVSFINPGTAHALFGNSVISHHYALVFGLELLSFAQYDVCQNRYLEPLFSGKLMFPPGDSFDPDTSAKIGQLIAQAEQLYQNTDPAVPAPLSIKIILLQILEILFSKQAFLSSGDNARWKSSEEYSLRPVFEYIKQHYQERITLEQLSSRLHMNKNYFCKFFKQKVGKTPFSYLNEYRINQAAALLLTTNSPITEIAMDTGFDNMSYFIRQFKHCKGCTPSAFRKMEHPGAVPIV